MLETEKTKRKNSNPPEKGVKAIFAFKRRKFISDGSSSVRNSPIKSMKISLPKKRSINMAYEALNFEHVIPAASLASLSLSILIENHFVIHPQGSPQK